MPPDVMPTEDPGGGWDQRLGIPMLSDPTKLTTDAVAAATQQIRRDVAAERDYVDGKIAMIETRILCGEDATTLRLTRLDQFPDMVDEKVANQRALMDERFLSLDAKFADIAGRTAEQKSDTKGAVDAALQAAKEAVTAQTEASEKSITKSETATTERIKAVEQTAAVSKDAADRQLNDLKERIVSLEASLRGDAQGVGRVHSDSQRTQALAFAILGVFLVIVGFAITILLSRGK